ncbi:MAG: hypothetical protein II230_07320, partial [Clostridia bacterium]|nr:hypothetical protein [Clostridia bacterium]
MKKETLKKLRRKVLSLVLCLSVIFAATPAVSAYFVSCENTKHAPDETNTAYSLNVSAADHVGNRAVSPVTFRTDKAPVTVTALPEALNLKYTGEAQPLVSPAVYEGGTAMYRLSENESWS